VRERPKQPLKLRKALRISSRMNSNCNNGAYAITLHNTLDTSQILIEIQVLEIIIYFFKTTPSFMFGL
jgi:hypothetical protein